MLIKPISYSFRFSLAPNFQEEVLDQITNVIKTCVDGKTIVSDDEVRVTFDPSTQCVNVEVNYRHKDMLGYNVVGRLHNSLLWDTIYSFVDKLPEYAFCDIPF